MQEFLVRQRADARRLGKAARLERQLHFEQIPDQLFVGETVADPRAREQLRAYLGTIPDYTTEVEGVKLSGVRAGGPAEKGGIKGGDIIIEFGGQPIKNVYDYTYALDAVKIGKPLDVVVLREGKRVKLSGTAEARK